MTLTTRTLPAYWASYLINNDASGIDPQEKAQADEFLAREKLPMPSNYTDERLQWQNDAHAIPHGGQVCEFIFILP